MKKYFLILLSFTLFHTAFANDIDDTSLIDKIEETSFEEISLDIKMRNFESCDAFEEVIIDYIKTYIEHTPQRRYYQVMPMMMESVEIQADAIMQESATEKSSSVSQGEDFSQTNIQVGWVDEPEIVKTDGRYLYYYNDIEKAIYIVDTQAGGIFAKSELEIVKRIAIPESFYGVELFLSDQRLVVIASAYSQRDYSKENFYIDRNSKTYTIVYDTSNMSQLQLLKFTSVDGTYTQSRLIDNTLYVLSQNAITFPYWKYSLEDNIVIQAEKFLPQTLDVSRTDTLEKHNLTLRDTNLPYHVTGGNATDCSEISYTLPSEETLKETGFSPGYTIVSSIDIQDTEKEIHSDVIAGSNTQIYMSQNNLYMTEGVWHSQNFSCPRNMICARPFFWGRNQNTLIHKLSIDGQDVTYKNSALIPWSPLNQYSMDEYEDTFRIITSEWSPETSTGLYILGSQLETISSLTGLAPGETFRSSRFIGEKLFLVTFEQIDPLFAIDLSDPTDPKVLWELKIPWFSTYLHPYDETHLIGLGYDTELNKWDRAQTVGVKVDLYKIHYDKKCGDENLNYIQREKCETGDYKWIIVEQLHSETFGGKGSDSQALRNPRMFVWNDARKRLLLPVNLYQKDESWKTQDYFNGLLDIEIEKLWGITLKNKITHIDITWLEERRIEECKKYTLPTEPECRELVSGEQVCQGIGQVIDSRYIPQYCYADTSVWVYVWDRSWDFRDMHVERALYIGDDIYSFSPSYLMHHNWWGEQQGGISFWQ